MSGRSSLAADTAQHANFQEHHPSFLAALLIGGLGYPVSVDIILDHGIGLAELYFRRSAQAWGLGGVPPECCTHWAT